MVTSAYVPEESLCQNFHSHFSLLLRQRLTPQEWNFLTVFSLAEMSVRYDLK